MSYNLKAEFDDIFFNGAQKREAKKKLNEFYDRFGENKRAIEDGTTMSEYMEYVMASAYADEVLKERREARMLARNNTSLMLRNQGQDMRDDMAKRREEFELSILRGENTKEKDEELSMSEEVKKVTEDKELEEKQKRQTDEDAKALKKLREQASEKELKQNDDEDYETDINKKMDILLKRSKEHLKSKDAEDLIEHIYLDIYGHLTIGAGKVIDDEKTFMSVNFMVDGRPATREEKKEAYRIFMKLREKGEYGNTFPAYKYENKSPLRVTYQTMEDLLDSHVRNDIKRLRSGMKEFESLPLALQEVLVDIRYNSGAITKELWPNLRRGISEQNLSLIMDNIRRGGIPEKRIKWAEGKIRSIKNWGHWEN